MHDLGSTLMFMSQANIMFDFLENQDKFNTQPEFFQTILHQACAKQAKHCVRFIVGLSTPSLKTIDVPYLIESQTEKLTPYQLALKKASPQVDDHSLSQILQELLRGERKLTRMGLRSIKEFDSNPDISTEHLYTLALRFERKKSKVIKSILNERKEFNSSLSPSDGKVMISRNKRILPPKDSHFYTVLFHVVFWALYLLNVFVINPKLNVWYFIMSTSMVSAKLYLTFVAVNRRDPGYLNKSLELCFTHQVLKDIPQHLICPHCKVIRTDSTFHCPVTDKCVDRYDHFSKLSVNVIGRGNHGMYLAYVFYLWLDVFLVGWIAVASVSVTECDLPDNQPCPLEALCIFGICHSMILHYLSTVGGAIICWILFFPTLQLCCRHCVYFGKGKTTL